MSTLSAPTEAAPVLAFLDNQQWNYLAAPDDYPSGHGLDLDELRRATQSRQLEIVGSLDLLQEVIGTARSNPTKYRRMVELFLEFVDRRILIPLSERHPAEVLHGAKLPDTDRYFSWADRWEIRRLAGGLSDVRAIGDEIYVEKRTFEEQEEAMREELREALEASDEGLSVRNPKDWFERTNLDELAHVAVAAGVDRGLYGPEYVEAGGYDRYPSVFTFVAARLARIFTNAGNRTIAASDLADAHHLASGPYVDVIVSDDKVMRTSFDLFANLVSFRVMPSLEFGEQVRVLHRSRTR